MPHAARKVPPRLNRPKRFAPCLTIRRPLTLITYSYYLLLSSVEFFGRCQRGKNQTVRMAFTCGTCSVHTPACGGTKACDQITRHWQIFRIASSCVLSLTYSYAFGNMYLWKVNVNIEWDERKNQANIVKHGISFGLAVHVFTDPLRKEAYDGKHSSPEEDRAIALGIAEGRLLFVSFTEPDAQTIRIISARKANRNERRYYYGNR